MKNGWELPYGEKVILDGIVRLLAPTTLFEFGTFTGETSVLLADAAPEGAVVHTVDLPEELDPEIGAIGQAFKDRPEYANTIVQHRVDLRSFDSEPFRGTVDFIFIDAAHDFNSVTKDSELALKMLRPGGCIVWDDYHPSQWGTVKALNELRKSYPLIRIAYSRFVVLPTMCAPRIEV
jgi:predicted O-methyltransferase YrrM